MKKMVSILAILAMLAAVPAATAFAADTASVSSVSEDISDETDIRNLVGQWKYQLAAENQNVDVSAIDNGIITVNEDSTYTYTDLDGNPHSGTVKLDYDTFGGDFKVPFFAFYEGDEFFIGCYCQQNNPNAYLIGNGGTAQLLSVSADFSAIVGKWEEKGGDERSFIITANGVYYATYPNGSTAQGYIAIGNKPFGNDGNAWYNFYNESGKAWISFKKTDDGVVNVLNEGEFSLMRMSEDPKNEYGFYTPSEYPVTSVSTAALIGTWKDAANEKATLTITEGRSLYNSKFEYTDGTETINGIVNLEYILTPDNEKEYWYTFYNIDGAFWNGFGVSGVIPLDDLYSGQDGAIHFVRQDERADEKNADKNEIAISRMNDLNTILAVLNASPMYTEESTDGDYVKVTDNRFSSISDVKNFISETCTGELKDELISDCDNCLIEKNGSLYVKHAYRSFYQFRTDKGVTINDPAMNYFSATTNENDALYGYGNAVFFFENGKWHIKSYEFGGTAPVTTTTAQTSNKYTSDELRDMAINDYESRTGVRPSSADVYDNAHGVTTVVLRDEAGNILDTYTLDPSTGIGANSNNETVELPQTGINSMKTIGAAAVAIAFILAGAGAVAKSGMLRKREDEE